MKNQRQMVGLLLDFPHYLISHKRNPGGTSWLRSATGMPDWGTNFYWEKINAMWVKQCDKRNIYEVPNRSP